MQILFAFLIPYQGSCVWYFMSLQLDQPMSYYQLLLCKKTNLLKQSHIDYYCQHGLGNCTICHGFCYVLHICPGPKMKPTSQCWLDLTVSQVNHSGWPIKTNVSWVEGQHSDSLIGAVVYRCISGIWKVFLSKMLAYKQAYFLDLVLEIGVIELWRVQLQLIEACLGACFVL